MRLLLVVFAVLFAGTVHAQEAASNFDQLRVLLKQGDRVTVTGSSGGDYEGRVIDITAATLGLQVGGQRREFGLDDVSRITQVRHADLGKGAAWGAGAGAGFGLVVALAQLGQCRGCGGWVLLSGLVWSGIGSGIGVGTAASMSSDHVIFMREGAGSRTISFAPILDRAHAGAMLSVRW